MNSKVYVVIVNYNGYADTIECLESLLKSTFSNFQVIVVDNSETDASFTELVKWSSGDRVQIHTNFEALVFPHVKKPIRFTTVTAETIPDLQINNLPSAQVIFVRSKVNNGFAAANNLALQLTEQLGDAKYLWLLNNDTVVDKNSLEELVKTGESAPPKTGMWGSKLLLYRDPSTLQGVGGWYNKWVGIGKEIGSHEKDNGQWDRRSFEFDYVIGASIFLRQAFLADVGFMNEEYFLYFEELDWAIRGKKKNWSLGFCPASKVYHKGGASINKSQKSGNSFLADYYALRNRILLTRKYFPFAFITLYPAFSKMFINRIRYKQVSRIPRLLGVLINPSKHFRK